MPYISHEQREHLDKDITNLVNTLVTISGDKGLDGCVNYVITRIVSKVYNTPYSNYAQKSNGIKAFECAKLEYYRRVMAPYEDTKIETEGDVY
jgi:hypothetical protein